MKTIIPMLILATMLSCTNDEDPLVKDSEEEKTLEHPQVPDEHFIDVDVDGTDDFEVVYGEFATDDEPSSGGSIDGFLRPLNGSQSLYKAEVGSLFLREGDRINKNENSNCTWTPYSFSVLTISREHEFWDKKWSIISQLKTDYYVGLKIKKDGVELVGFMILGFNVDTGEISVLDKNLSADDSIIIRK